MSKAFITGSYVYGTPDIESDVDLVILTDEDTANFLASHFCDEVGGSDSETGGSFSLVIGKLNIICCFDEKLYNAWLQGTLVLSKQKLDNQQPVSRETAIEYMQSLRNQL